MRPHAFIAIVVALVAGACGDGEGAVETVPASISSTVLDAEDVEFSVQELEGGEICYSGSSTSFGLESFEDCSSMAEYTVLTPLMGVPLVPGEQGLDGWATVFGTRYDITIVDVRQDGEPVPWLQDGRAVLVLGGYALTAQGRVDTMIRYAVGRQSGVCQFSTAGDSCSLD